MNEEINLGNSVIMKKLVEKNSFIYVLNKKNDFYDCFLRPLLISLGEKRFETPQHLDGSEELVEEVFDSGLNFNSADFDLEVIFLENVIYMVFSRGNLEDIDLKMEKLANGS